MHFFMIRHGLTDWNILGKWQGHSDMPLNETGVLQAKKLAARLKNVNLGNIYSSDLIRAVKTAEIVSGNKKITVRKDLREIYLGEWEGLTEQQISSQPESYNNFISGEFPAPGGESKKQCRDRISEAVHSIADSENDFFTIVSHGATIRSFIVYVMNGSLETYIPMHNTSLSEFIYDKNTKKFTLVTANDAAHLEERVLYNDR
jgi:broad specificity phosphatase PhoE